MSGFILTAFAVLSLTAQPLPLPLRSRSEDPKGSGNWQAVTVRQDLPISETAILICDMWNNHWCKGAARRVDELAQRMNPVLEQARAAGIQIIHSPSEVTAVYADAPQRPAMLSRESIACWCAPLPMPCTIPGTGPTYRTGKARGW